MDKELVISVTGGETRSALLEDRQLAELSVERSKKTGMVGTIYKGRVKKVLPGMQSAFVDIGLAKDAFLYVSDVDDRLKNFDILDDEYLNQPSKGSAKRGKRVRARRKIDQLLDVGQEVLVQILREPLGTKGARVTTHLSIAGRYLVLMPTVNHIGVSRKIRSFAERKRLKNEISSLKLKDMGVIIRTAAGDKDAKDIKKDLKNLVKEWKHIKKLADKNPTPSIVYEDDDITIRTIRDLLDDRFKNIYIDDKKKFKRLKTFLTNYSPEHKKMLQLWSEKTPLFEHFDIEEKIQKLFRNKIWLKSGGHLVINQMEALVAIDINTGKFVGAKNLEDTILKLNLEAIEEIVRQIRLRDLGGIIVIDFIDMETKQNRKKVINAFYRAMRRDRGQYKILPINEFGLLQLTRKRVKSSFVKTMSQHCPYCEGMGYVKSHKTICYEIMREVIRLNPHLSSRELILRAHPEIIKMLNTEENQIIRNLEKATRKKFVLKEDIALHLENFDIMSV